MFPAIETLPAIFAIFAADKVSAKAFLLKALAVLMVVPARLAPVSNIPATPFAGNTTLLLKLFQLSVKLLPIFAPPGPPGPAPLLGPPGPAPGPGPLGPPGPFPDGLPLLPELDPPAPPTGLPLFEKPTTSSFKFPDPSPLLTE